MNSSVLLCTSGSEIKVNCILFNQCILSLAQTFFFSIGSVQFDGLKINMLHRVPWKYGNFQKSYEALCNPIEISTSCKQILWMFTTPLHRSSCSCQTEIYWNFVTLFGDVLEWLGNVALPVCKVRKDLWQVTLAHISPRVSCCSSHR